MISDHQKRLILALGLFAFGSVGIGAKHTDVEIGEAPQPMYGTAAIVSTTTTTSASAVFWVVAKKKA